MTEHHGHPQPPCPSAVEWTIRPWRYDTALDVIAEGAHQTFSLVGKWFRLVLLPAWHAAEGLALGALSTI
jgi:hypothetical protein